MEVVFFLEIKTDEEEDREENLTRTHHPKRIENQMFPLFPRIINHRRKNQPITQQNNSPKMLMSMFAV